MSAAPNLSVANLAKKNLPPTRGMEENPENALRVGDPNPFPFSLITNPLNIKAGPRSLIPGEITHGDGEPIRKSNNPHRSPIINPLNIKAGPSSLIPGEITHGDGEPIRKPDNPHHQQVPSIPYPKNI